LGYLSGVTSLSPGASHVLRRAPDAALAPFVRRFLVVEFPNGCRDHHLPELGAVAAFSFRGECRSTGVGCVPPAAFTGLWETLRGHEHGVGHAVLLAQFTPLGAAAFVRQSLDEFTGTTVDLTDVLPRSANVRALGERIAAAVDHGARIRLLEQYLFTLLAMSTPDPLISAAVAWLGRAPGPTRIDALATHIGLSQSALERRFQRVVGLTPKRYALLLRFRRALALRSEATGWTSVAHTAGYFDQSHFINHFRRITGVSPAEPKGPGFGAWGCSRICVLPQAPRACCPNRLRIERRSVGRV
jgi:AraC-like DNA-binding protein